MAIDRQYVDNCLQRILACGPRGAGSAGGRRSADLIADLFGGAGLTVTREEFAVPLLPLILVARIVPLVGTLAMVAAGMMYVEHPAVSAVIMAAGLALIYGAIRWYRFAGKVFPVGRRVACANIVGRSEPVLGDRDTLILVAHYDSKSETVPLAVRVVTFFVAFALGIGLLILAVLAWVGLVFAPWVAWAVTITASACLILHVFNFTGNRSPGALDNASGLAVLATLAETLTDQLASRANLIFVATDAEELGLAGISEFIRDPPCRLDPQRTFCLNFDTIGAGGVVYSTGSSKPFEHLRSELDRYLADQGLRPRHIRLIGGVGMDHMPLQAAGYWAVSLTQGPIGSILQIHRPGDTADLVDTTALTSIAQAVAQLAASITEPDDRARVLNG